MKAAESKSFTKILFSGVIASLIGVIITLMLTLLFSLFISSGHFNESATEFAYLTAIPGAVFAGMLSAKSAGHKMLFYGMLGGSLFFLLLLAIAAVCLPSLPLTSRTIAVFICCILGSIIGSILAPKR